MSPLTAVPTIQESFIQTVRSIYCVRVKGVTLQEAYQIGIELFWKQHQLESPFKTFAEFEAAYKKS
ncbi:hypothetical protein BWI93_19170 [Siphonobacter sp. BAB-5385]|nr:hypothetical protein BWI93_19170 [Siphonobacter sp. BAB-5385]